MKGKIYYNQIIDKRLRLDITQKTMSDESGISLSIIKQIETGRSVSTVENLKTLCEYLDLNIDDVYKADYRETAVISVINNKGGVGKTSVTSSLSYALSEMNKKVLCIDGDMSMNLTDSMGIERTEKHFGRAIEKEEDLIGYIKPTQYNNIDFIVSDESMSNIDMILFTKIERESIVKHILRNIVNQGIYDYIIFDTNPVLSMLNYNILNASNYVIIPVTLERFSITGLNTLIKTINSTKKTNEDIKIAGILINKYDRRQKIMTEDCEEILNELHKDLLFKTIISVDSKISQAQMKSIPVLATDKNSRISSQYKDFAKEVNKIVKR